MVVFGPEAALTAFREGESRPDGAGKARQGGGWENRSGKRRTGAQGPSKIINLLN